MKSEKPRIVHFSKQVNRRHVLFCRDSEGVWGFETTGIHDRVTCPQCKKLLGRDDGKSQLN